MCVAAATTRRLSSWCSRTSSGTTGRTTSASLATSIMTQSSFHSWTLSSSVSLPLY